MKVKKRHKGFTLVENIIVMLLLAVIVVGSLNIYPAVMGFVSKQEDRLIADNLAYSQLEDLRRIARSVSFDNSALSSGDHGYTTAITIPACISSLTYNVTFTTDDNHWPEDTTETVDYKTVVVTCTTTSGYSATLTEYVTP